jgi:hypothetical protein
MSGAGFGAHDAYAAHSLDDGTTWKRTNLSLSADLSSFILANGHEYPGDAHNMTFAIAGDKVLVGWISKYCDGGSPMYTFTDEDVLALQEEFDLPDLYVRDIWGVAGAQSSVDYTLQGFPEVGEIPYSCVWSARGQLLPVSLDDETPDTKEGYDIIWTKAERLTSGRRDANRLEMNGDSAAGFMMTWQEDPEGLRPGTGLGPGEGWSGAVVNQQTDLWYSFISIDDFVMVMSDDTDEAIAEDIAEYDGETTPKVAVPMAMPVRLTDNKMCKATGSDPYCYVNFDNENPWLTDLDYVTVDWDDPDSVKAAFTQSEGLSTLCTTTESWTNPGGTTLPLCQAEDGRVMQGRVGASRPRVNVQPYDADSNGNYDNAWVIMGAEESKALGEGSSGDSGGGQPIDEVEPADVGKNMWYYSFDMLNPEFVAQGGMLNQPATCTPGDAGDSERCPNGEGEFYALLTDDFGNEFYETEISRRFSHFSQPIHQIGNSGVSAVLIVKQGILNQGGPADIFLRRIVMPDSFDLTVDNPYAFEYMDCPDDPADPNDGWVYKGTVTDPETGLVRPENPRYVEGLCLSNMINVSGGTIVSCDNGTSGDDCAAAFPWDGQEDIDNGFPKVTEWRQCDGLAEIDGCDNINDPSGDLDDQSWENPYDVAKGHRGFIDGNFILMMYAWSPNWQANSVGNDHYNLYARRSFDGGETWTTTPADLGGTGEDAVDDPTACENYKNGTEITTVCFTAGPGDFEQSRNLSQLVGNKETILDPRYSPTGGIKMLPITDLKGVEITDDYGDFTGYGYDDDERDPSKFFIVYETGDNTTVAEGEAVPLDLFYSRAVNWGDDYDLAEYEKDGEIELGFDWLEHDREDLSGEAANLANNGGTFYYAIWNQWQEDEEENVSNSDAIFRRIMYLDDVDDESTAPVVNILYVSHTMPQYGENLVLVGSARDGDQAGGLPLDDIGEIVWTDTFDGVTSVLVDDDDDPKRLNYPVRNLQPGWHEFGFKASDKGGNWSPGVSVRILVTEIRYEVFLPQAQASP